MMDVDPGHVQADKLAAQGGFDSQEDKMINGQATVYTNLGTHSRLDACD